jgi:hypothetical protein
MVANHLTKPLARNKFETFHAALGLRRVGVLRNSSDAGADPEGETTAMAMHPTMHGEGGNLQPLDDAGATEMGQVAWPSIDQADHVPGLISEAFVYGPPPAAAVFVAEESMPDRGHGWRGLGRGMPVLEAVLPESEPWVQAHDGVADLASDDIAASAA